MHLSIYHLGKPADISKTANIIMMQVVMILKITAAISYKVSFNYNFKSKFRSLGNKQGYRKMEEDDKEGKMNVQ